MYLLDIQDFDDVYALFQKAFIPAELRPYEKMKRLFQNQELMIYGIKQEDKIVAGLIVWQLKGFIYLENFAVDQTLRGQGIGGIILQETKRLYPHQTIVLEVEKPFDEMSQRRVGFYQRHGFIFNPFSYIQPTLDVEPTNVLLYLMSYPHNLQEPDFQVMKEEIFKVVYHQNVKEL